MTKGKGWNGERQRHSMASKGIKTKVVTTRNKGIKYPSFIKNGVYNKNVKFVKKDGNFYEFDEITENQYRTLESVVIYAENQKELDNKIAFLEQNGIIPKSWKTNYKGYDVSIIQDQTPDRTSETWTISISKNGVNILRGSADYRGAGKLNDFNDYTKTEKYKPFGVEWKGIGNRRTEALTGNTSTYHQSHFLNVESSIKSFINQIESGQIKKKPQVTW